MRLQVPLIQQETSMVCWHASAQMLAAYRQMSIDPLDDSFQNNQGLTPSQFISLAQAVGLVTLPQVNQSYDSSFINSILSSYGPIWCAGYWDGLPHIIVVVGVDDSGTLEINDPARQQPRFQDMGWFNSRIATQVPYPMMYLPAS